MNKYKFFAVASLLSAFSSLSFASNTTLSDYFQDWQLNADKTSASCPVYFSGEPGAHVPGVLGMPGPNDDSSNSIRFIKRESGSYSLLALGKHPSSETDGDVTVSIEGNKLKAVDRKSFLGFSKTYRQDAYTLLSDGGLVVDTLDRSGKVECVYTNLHPDVQGKTEVGAALYVQGKKVAQCSFEPATPRPDQVNFVYNEKCDFGKFTRFSTINDQKVVMKSDMALSTLAHHDLEIFRSAGKLNASTENFVAFDDEIAVEDSTVDDVWENKSSYFASPYRSTHYRIQGTQTSYIQFIYK